MPDLEAELKARFGFDRFRPLQKEIISELMRGNSVVGILPTGAGKSICYQLPALLFQGITIVVSPLISLMKDQTDRLVASGIPAIAINSHDTLAEGRSKLAEMAHGKAKLVFVAPERLHNQNFMTACNRVKVSLLAVDEAHCVSQWGHDFRPEYRQIPAFHSLVGLPPLLALTATARPSVREDLMQQLGLQGAQLFRASADRPNLWIGVEACRSEVDREAKISSILRHQPGSAIVYVMSRRDAEALSEALERRLGESVACYHAGMGVEGRTAVQNQFMTNIVRVVVATNAFGMGIDKPDIRTVVHAGVPDSLEAYLQEIGRAGRDGLHSRCVMVLIPGRDVKVREFLLKQSEDPHATERFRRMCAYVYLTTECRRGFLIRYFGERRPPQPENCCSYCHPIEFPCETVLVASGSGRGRRGPSNPSAQPATSHRTVTEPGLLEHLKQWRRRKAAEMGVPAFVIFGDRDIVGIAEAVPGTPEELSSCRGMGSTKLRLYGGELLAEISRYADQSIFDHVPPPGTPSAPEVDDAAEPPKSVSERKRQEVRAELIARTGRLFGESLDPKTIAREIGRAEATVWQYLVEWIGTDTSGAWKEAVRRVLSREAYRDIVSVLRNQGEGQLKPVYERFGGRYTYGQIRVARAVFDKTEGDR